MILFLLPLLSWSQSYPYQRIEGGDTVVVMTKKQGNDINSIFKTNKIVIDSLYIRNGLLVNHVLKYDSTLKESMMLNNLLDSLLSSETATYQREIIKEIEKDKKINKIMGTSWFILFILFITNF